MHTLITENASEARIIQRACIGKSGAGKDWERRANAVKAANAGDASAGATPRKATLAAWRMLPL